MQEVRNSENKLVCCINKVQKTVEIMIKGCKTTIKFLDDGTVKIVNTNKVA